MSPNIYYIMRCVFDFVRRVRLSLSRVSSCSNLHNTERCCRTTCWHDGRPLSLAHWSEFVFSTNKHVKNAVYCFLSLISTLRARVLRLDVKVSTAVRDATSKTKWSAVQQQNLILLCVFWARIKRSRSVRHVKDDVNDDIFTPTQPKWPRRVPTISSLVDDILSAC